MAFLRKAISFACVFGALSLATGTTRAEPQNGWWWNPSESGRGFFIEATGGVIYLAGYFYDVNGRATWLSSGGSVNDPYSYSGTLQSYRNGQSAFGGYRPPDPAVDVGPVTLSFSDDSHGTITWPGGTVPIERYGFGTEDSSGVFDSQNPLNPEFRPKTGWWWNAAESGSGYSVEIQGDTAFVVGFMYDEGGDPIWYLAAGPMSSPTHFEGDWLEFSGGQTLSGSYRPPGTPRQFGRVTIDFTSFDGATIAFNDGAATPLTKVAPRSLKERAARSRGPGPIVPVLAPRLWTEPQMWPHFACELTRKIVAVTEAGTTGTITLTETSRHHAVFDYLKDSVGSYRLNVAESYMDYSFHSVDSSNGCTETASVSGYNRLDYGTLDINPYGLFYRGLINNYNLTVPLIDTVVSGGDGCGGSRKQPLPAEFAIHSRSSTVQRANPYPSSPPPLMKVRNSHTESDGSSIEWGWDCTAYAGP